MTKKQLVSTIFLIAAVAMVVFFTLQDAEGTMALSESVRAWLAERGIEMESHQLRSDIHVLEYFLLALAVLAFGLSWGWPMPVCIIACCLFGLLDEGVKVLLPTREFDGIDLLKDWLGVCLAAACVLAFTPRRPRQRA